MKHFALILAGLLLFLLISIEVFRAVNIGMTHDESYSYTRYVEHPYIDIMTYRNVVVLPNNHILNTIGMKFFSSILHNCPFVLRLPNLLAFGFFCIVFLYWLKKSAYVIMYVPITVLLFFNPYVLDFFLLARGYGMGMCLMMMSIFLIDRLSVKNVIKTSALYLPLICAALSVYANFGFLNFYFGFIAVIEIMIFYQYFTRNQERDFYTFVIQHIPVLIISGLLLLVIYWPMHQILAAHQLYGGMDGFWTNTVASLISRTAYEAAYAPQLFSVLQSVIILTVFASCAVVSFVCLKNGKQIVKHPLFQALLFLLLPVLINVAEHRILNTEFPEDRTGVFYVPLFMFLLVQLIIYTRVKAVAYLCYSVSFLLAIHLFLNLNLTYVVEWKYDMNTAKMMSDLNSMHQGCNSGGQEIRFGCNFLFEPSVNYYRQYLNMKCIPKVERDGLANGIPYDFVYGFEKNDWEFKNVKDYSVLRKYDISQTALFKLR